MFCGILIFGGKKIMAKHHEPNPHCDTCGHKASGPRPNRIQGGWFFVCETCDRTWDIDRNPNPFSHPGLSYRNLIERKLREAGLDPEEALNELGLFYCAELVGVVIKKAA
jgi:hypothetical protein